MYELRIDDGCGSPDGVQVSARFFFMKTHPFYPGLLLLSICLIFSCNGNEIEDPVIEDTTPVLEEFFYRDVEAAKTIILQGKHLDKLKWKSYNPFCAVAEGGKLYTKHIGHAQIITTGEDHYGLKVLVTPKYNDYDLPYVCQPGGYTINGVFWPDDGPSFWNCGPATISAYEKERVKDYRSTNSLVVYKTGNTKSPYVCYFFQNGKLTQAGTIISLSDLSNLPYFLKERYDVFSVDLVNYSAYFEHKHDSDESIDYVGGVQYSSQLGGLLLALMPPTKTKAQNITAVMEQMSEELALILN